MADNTHIEWTDATWNPITGCSVVSAGCKHCYAMKLAGTRLKHEPSRAGLTIDTKAGPVWNGEVRFNEQWLDQPLRWRRPRRIFVCAHGDLFHENVPDEWIDRVFAVMALATQHQFQVLTKRAARMRDYVDNRLPFALQQLIPWICNGGIATRQWHDACRAWRNTGSYPQAPLRNVWLGVSVEDQAAANERIPLLLQCPAAVRWISAEPLLGPVDLAEWLRYQGPLDARTGVARREDYERRGLQHGIDWVVAGGESGTGARPMHPDWARSLRDQCAEAGVPFLFKQWGRFKPYDFLDFGPGRRMNDAIVFHPPGMKPADMIPVGKKAAGRHLDGVLHDGYPAS